MNKIMCTLLALCVCGFATAQESFSTLEEQMTGKEFLAAGLDKLSEQELAALNAWLRDHSLGTLATPAAARAGASAQSAGDTRGFESDVADVLDDSDIVSRLVGGFTGFDGNTVFRLENGQVWKQADSTRMDVPEVENPKVTISQGMFKAWRLTVEGFGKRVRVERLQ